MENSSKSLSSNRFVIEDSIPKVTSDGEPHEVMTMVAMISGLIAAAIVLFILFSLIGTRRQTNENEETECDEHRKDSKSGASIIPIFSTPKKCYESERDQPQLLSVSTISDRVSSMEGNVNYGFRNSTTDSEYSMNSSALIEITTVHC